jgi:hypothetical protein
MDLKLCISLALYLKLSSCVLSTVCIMQDCKTHYWIKKILLTSLLLYLLHAQLNSRKHVHLAKKWRQKRCLWILIPPKQHAIYEPMMTKYIRCSRRKVDLPPPISPSTFHMNNKSPKHNR